MTACILSGQSSGIKSVTPGVRAEASKSKALRVLLASYARSEDLIRIGAYQKGSDPRTDEAIALYPRLSAFLQQETDEPVNLADAESGLADTTKTG